MKEGRKSFVFGVMLGVIEILLSLLVIAAGYFLVRYVHAVYVDGELLWKETIVRGYGLTMMLVAGITGGVALAVTVACSIARSAVKKHPSKKSAKIFMIVAGILGNVFFILSGLFALGCKDEK